MKIFIMTDMEGVTGVFDFDNYCADAGIHYQNSRKLLTMEVNAVAAGFFDAGADEIHVQIGHHHDSVDRELLDRRVLLMSGHTDPIWPWGLDAGYDALAVVGQHAKAGSDYAHLAHTGNIGVTDQRINDLSIGEYGAIALCAMELGIPTIFASGDRALAEEARALTPGVATVYGKWGRIADAGRSRSMGRDQYNNMNLASVQLHPAAVREQLCQTAAAALKKLGEAPGSFRYPRLKAPYRLIREHRTHAGEPGFALIAEEESIIQCLNRLYAPDNPRVPLNADAPGN